MRDIRIEPLLYGSYINFPYKVELKFMGIVFSTKTVLMVCTVEMSGRKQDKITEKTKKIKIKPIDPAYDEITVFLSDVMKDILEMNEKYFIPNS